MREDPDMKAYLDSYYRSVAEQEELLEGNIPPLFEFHDERVRRNAGMPYLPLGQWEQWQTTRHADAYTARRSPPPVFQVREMPRGGPEPRQVSNDIQIRAVIGHPDSRTLGDWIGGVRW